MSPRALVVVDDLPTREALSTVVEGEGFAVDAVTDGELALELLGRNSYALILLEIVLPRMSGAAVMEHLHAHAPQVLETVIVVTGLDVSEVRKLYPGVREALRRPVLPARLRKAVRRFLPEQGEASGISVA